MDNEVEFRVLSDEEMNGCYGEGSQGVWMAQPQRFIFRDGMDIHDQVHTPWWLRSNTCVLYQEIICLQQAINKHDFKVDRLHQLTSV